jgi:hypothetical protein
MCFIEQGGKTFPSLSFLKIPTELKVAAIMLRLIGQCRELIVCQLYYRKVQTGYTFDNT